MRCKQADYKNIEVVVVDNASKNESISKIKEADSDIKIYAYSKNGLALNGSITVDKNGNDLSTVKKLLNLHYHALGVMHAYLGIIGRFNNPERFLT